MRIADFVALRQGHPVVVVEAKGSPVPAKYAGVVREQLRTYADAVRPGWVVLVDPNTVEVFRSSSLTRPCERIATDELAKRADVDAVALAGESILLLIVDRWFESVRQDPNPWIKRYPKLATFLREVARSDQAIREFPVN